MAPVAMPMRVMVTMSVRRRPMRSPRCPNTIAPIGRTTKAIAIDRNAVRVAPNVPSGSKNRGPTKNAAKYA